MCGYADVRMKYMNDEYISAHTYLFICLSKNICTFVYPHILTSTYLHIKKNICTFAYTHICTLKYNEHQIAEGILYYYERAGIAQ